MNIGMIVQTQYPNDSRIEREARIVMGAGYRVYVLCARQGNQPSQEQHEGVSVSRIDALKGYFSWLNYTFYKLFLLDVYWLWHLYSFVRRNEVRLIHVQHNLPIVPAALVIGKLCHIPIIFDVHDSHPDAMVAWDLETSWSERVFLGRNRMYWLEKTCARLAAGVVIANDYRDIFHAEYGVSSNKVLLLPNVPDIAWLNTQEIDQTVKTSFEGKYIILYYGSFGFNRGIDTAIRAMRQVREQVPNAVLVLVGPATPYTESRQVEYLAKIVAEEHLSDVVHFTGPVPEHLISTYLSIANVGILPLNRTVHYERSLANKLFAYMAFGKPVIVTDLKAQASIVKEEGCGLIVSPQDPSAFADAIIRLHDHATLAKEMGSRGKHAIEEKYNIGILSNDLIHMYSQLTGHI